MTGTVEMLVPPTRALVTLDDQRLVAVWGDTIPGASGIDHLVQPGQRVEGLLDPASGRLDVSPHLHTVAVLLATTNAGDVILIRVKAVARDELLLTVWPGVHVPLRADQITGNPLDDLRDLATPGEVVPARVLALPPTLVHTELAEDSADENAEDNVGHGVGEPVVGWELSLLDVDPDDEPTTPPHRCCPAGRPGSPPPPRPARTRARARVALSRRRPQHRSFPRSRRARRR